jgi:TadE-like protein
MPLVPTQFGVTEKRLTASSRHCGSERGGALVEYAFAIMIFISLVFGIGGFGQALYVYHFVNNIAKEATRWSAVNGYACDNVHGDNSCNGTVPMNNGPAQLADVDTYVKNHAPSGIDTTKIATSGCGIKGQTACADSTPQVCLTGNANFVAINYPGCTVQVKVAYALTFIFPLLPKSNTTTAPCTKPGICIASQSEMVIVH